MILIKVELTNFRSYQGTHTIDLGECARDPEKNIVAVGGLNGSGKTTFLDAITFTLLGVAPAFKFIEEVERKGDGRLQIERTLEGLLNRESRETGVREAQVRLTFLDDDTHTFCVQRTWIYDQKGRFKEDPIVVTVDNSALAEDQYDDFVKNRIPPEVVKFFIFDGEKIQAIAQDEVGDSVIKGIDSLLGFHLLEALVSDMDHLQDEYRKEAQRRNRQEEELSDLRSQETKLNNQIGELEDDQFELEDRVSKLKDKSSILVDELNRLLGGEGTSPKDIQSQLDRTTDTIRDIKDKIQNAIDRWVIPAMPVQLLKKLSKQLSGEEQRAQWEEGRSKVEPQRNRLVDRVFGNSSPQPNPPLDSSQIKFLRGRVFDEWEDLFNPPPAGIAETVIHSHLSSEERGQVRAKCNHVVQSAASDLHAHFGQLDSAERKARNLRQQLDRVGDGERANAIIEEKSKVDRELGEAQQAWDSIKRRIQSLQVDLREVRRELRKKEDELLESGQSNERANFVRKVKRVIERYREELRPRKRDEVARHLTEMYRRLARKEDVVDCIELDDKSYRPRLLDRRGRVMPLHSLSAGEREIYALSLLWALAKTSRRTLPVLIDTPLARLDSEHRANIVKRYLPQAGPQVIVLSTDTEIDRDNFGLIEEYVAKTLYLEFDPSTERTTVHTRYFNFD